MSESITIGILTTDLILREPLVEDRPVIIQGKNIELHHVVKSADSITIIAEQTLISYGAMLETEKLQLSASTVVLIDTELHLSVSRMSAINFRDYLMEMAVYGIASCGVNIEYNTQTGKRVADPFLLLLWDRIEEFPDCFKRSEEEINRIFADTCYNRNAIMQWQIQNRICEYGGIERAFPVCSREDGDVMLQRKLLVQTIEKLRKHLASLPGNPNIDDCIIC